MDSAFHGRRVVSVKQPTSVKAFLFISVYSFKYNSATCLLYARPRLQTKIRANTVGTLTPELASGQTYCQVWISKFHFGIEKGMKEDIFSKVCKATRVAEAGYWSSDATNTINMIKDDLSLMRKYFGVKANK